MSEDVVIACFNRCLVCSRVTPHEVCHEHSYPLGGRWPDMVPTGELQEDGEPYLDFPEGTRERGFSLSPEHCSGCPQSKVDWQ